MSQIDWSKAPEGATHYCPGAPGVLGAVGRFYNVNKSPMWVDFREGAGWQVSHNRPEGIWLDTLVARPTTPQWNGTGLPTVGVVCECQDSSLRWKRGVIVHVGADRGMNIAVMQCDDEILWGERGEFRPIRTPEQIAAEERENELNRMVATVSMLDKGWARKVCAGLYDAGYRKP